MLLVPDLAGGALYTAHQFAGALSARHRVRVVGPAAPEVWRPLRDECRVDAVLPGANPLSPRVRRAFEREAGGVGLIYAFKALPQSLGLGLRARRRLGIPLALHLDDWDGGWFTGVSRARRVWYAAKALHRLNSEPYVRMMESLVPRADVLTVSTGALQRRFGGALVPQGVDTERVSPARFPRPAARERLGVPPGMPLILFLGTPQVHKGLGELLAAYQRLRACSAALWVVGSPRDARVAEEVLSGAGPDVEFRPSVSFEEACWYISAADAFVVPQRATAYAEHQLPAKLLQAMALGAPIVATAVGDAREILGGEPAAGVIVPPGDTGALAEAIAALLSDPGRGRALGAEARGRAEREYGWRAMALRLERALAPLALDG